jgi:hypothetical protein
MGHTVWHSRHQLLLLVMRACMNAAVFAPLLPRPVRWPFVYAHAQPRWVLPMSLHTAQMASWHGCLPPAGIDGEGVRDAVVVAASLTATSCLSPIVYSHPRVSACVFQHGLSCSKWISATTNPL